MHPAVRARRRLAQGESETVGPLVDKVTQYGHVALHHLHGDTLPGDGTGGDWFCAESVVQPALGAGADERVIRSIHCQAEEPHSRDVAELRRGEITCCVLTFVSSRL